MGSESPIIRAVALRDGGTKCPNVSSRVQREGACLRRRAPTRAMGFQIVSSDLIDGGRRRATPLRSAGARRAGARYDRMIYDRAILEFVT